MRRFAQCCRAGRSTSYLFTFLLFYLFTFNQLFYLFTFLLLTSFFTFKSESSFHHNQVFFPSQPSLLFIATKSSFHRNQVFFSKGIRLLLWLRVYFPKYTQSAPEVHHEHCVDTHSVICDFFKKGVLMYFFWKIISVIVYEGILIHPPYRRDTLARFLFSFFWI